MPWCPHITILLAAGGASDATQTSISPRVSGQGRRVSCDPKPCLRDPRGQRLNGTVTQLPVSISAFFSRLLST